MPLCQRHIKWMTQAWAKRLCQSCGLPVSQVLMCTLSATRTDKIGNRAHFLQPQRLAQKLPPPAHPTFPKKNCFLFFSRLCERHAHLNDRRCISGWWQSSLRHAGWVWRVSLVLCNEGAEQFIGFVFVFFHLFLSDYEGKGEEDGDLFLCPW